MNNGIVSSPGPFHDSLCLRLHLPGPAVDKLVGEISIEVLSVCVGPPLDAGPVLLAASLEAVGVHGGHDVDAGGVDQPCDPLVETIVLQQVLTNT